MTKVFRLKKPIFKFKFLAIKWAVRSETTTIGKLEPSTFRLYSMYRGNGSTPGPEIALEMDHTKRGLFPYFWSIDVSKTAELL
jgi:hypothetical protein